MNAINTVLLSYGLSGKVFHAPFIAANAGFRLVGAWERSKKQIGDDYPGARSYGSLDEVLSDRQVDLVIVNTPTNTHADFATKALQAGKHVIVEKAFTTNTEEALALSRMAAKAGMKLSVFHNRRWDSDFKTVQKVMDDGLLGDIVEAQIAYERYNPVLSPKAHRETPGPGAGNLMDLGPHCVDQALMLFGMPEAIFADVRTCRPGSQVDDYFDIVLFYGKLRVRLKSSYLVREAGPGFIMHGTKGSFLKRRSDVQETQLKQGMKPDAANFGIEPESLWGLLNTEVNGSLVRETIESQPGNYGGYYDRMRAAILENADVPVSSEEGVRVMRVLDAAVESNKRKAVVQL